MISTPTYSANPDIADCFWFLETKNSEDTIVLSNSDFLSYQRMKLISTTARSSEYDHYGRWQNPSPVSTVPPLAESPSLIASFFPFLFTRSFFILLNFKRSLLSPFLINRFMTDGVLKVLCFTMGKPKINGGQSPIRSATKWWFIWRHLKLENNLHSPGQSPEYDFYWSCIKWYKN